MAIQLTIAYETLLDLVDQLTPEEQHRLMKHLQQKKKEETLSGDEFRVVFDNLMAERDLSASGDTLNNENWNANDAH